MTSQTVFSHGSVDPWHALGIIHHARGAENNRVTFIDGTAHCADIYPSRPGIDLPSLTQSRQETIAKLAGDVFIPRGVDVHALDGTKMWEFNPTGVKVSTAVTSTA